MDIKEIFGKAENGTLTLEQFEAIAKEGNAKFTDLSEGKYVSKSKYEDDIGAKDSTIEQLNTTISQRDTDLADLQTKLNEAGTDATKLSELQTSFDTLQTKYAEDTNAYEQKLADKKYEFAVKEFANGKEFTSQAAKRDFVRSLTAEKLKMKGDTIIGAEDFVTAYTAENADAFVVKQDTPPADTNSAPNGQAKPRFISTTPGTQAPKQPTLSEMMLAANQTAGVK